MTNSFAVSEIERLERVASDSWYANGANGASIRYRSKLFARYWHGSRCLELGPAEGLLSEALVTAFPDVTLVDGSAYFCEQLRSKFPRATVVQDLFEEYEPAAPFDAIVLGHVLEHVDSPRSLLGKVHEWLAPGGAVYASSPNARSVHRQAAVLLGMLAEEHALNDTDRHHGHRRVYDPESFRADFLATGFRIDVFGGYWLKPLSNSQIEQTWSASMLDAYMQVGERYPDIAAEIYVVASAAR